MVEKMTYTGVGPQAPPIFLVDGFDGAVPSATPQPLETVSQWNV
jgi:hypothetical protein